jgi:hypothetical protein
MQERSASVTAEHVKTEVLAKVSIAMSEKDPAIRVTKAVFAYYFLHRNLRLDYINGKPKKAVEHLVSGIKPSTLKALIESKLEMDMSELKKDFLEFVDYLKKLAIIHDEHCHAVEHKKTGDSGMMNTVKSSNAGSHRSGHNSGRSSHEGASSKASDRDRTKSGHGRSSDSTGTAKQSAREPPPCLNAQKCAGEKDYLYDCPYTGRTKPLSCCLSTRKREMPTRRRPTLRLWATTERRRKTEMARPRISWQRISESRSRYWQTQALTTPLYRAVLWRTQGSVSSLSRSSRCRSPSC